MYLQCLYLRYDSVKKKFLKGSYRPQFLRDNVEPPEGEPLQVDARSCANRKLNLNCIGSDRCAEIFFLAMRKAFSKLL